MSCCPRFEELFDQGIFYRDDRGWFVDTHLHGDIQFINCPWCGATLK